MFISFLLVCQKKDAVTTGKRARQRRPEKGDEAAAPTPGPEALKAKPPERGPTLIGVVRRPLERGTP